MSLSGCAVRAFGSMLLLSLMPTAVSSAEPVSVRFANSCAAGVQADFSEAVTLLHSFEYPESTRIFGAIIAADPTCAMARWGLAMSTWHPLWAPPGAAELEYGAALLAETDSLEATGRERAYLAAAAQFYSDTDPDTHRQRAAAYERAMAAVYQAHLDDPEAATFYALALLASADPHDKTYRHQYQAAALLNWVRESEPLHPGVLHYLIHSYDYPGLAHLAYEVATVYAAAAPASAHAQHMPSHIFTRLGLWDRSIASNHDSTHSAAEYTKSARLPGHYDEGVHSMDYLVYALLQSGRDAEARAQLERLAAIERTDTENFKVAYTLAASPGRYVLERRAWEEAAELALIREDFDWASFGWALSIHHFARGIGAARAGMLDAARVELEAIVALEQSLPAATPPYWREEVTVQRELVAGWIAFETGDAAGGLMLARTAAEREDAVDKHPVTPGEILPARELYADMLLAAGEPEAALGEYQTVLAASPNRLNALLGAGKAASAAGEAALAAGFRQTAMQQASAGTRQLGLD